MYKIGWYVVVGVHSRSLENSAIQQSEYEFLLAFHSRPIRLSLSCTVSQI